MHITKPVLCRVKLKEEFSYLDFWEIERDHTHIPHHQSQLFLISRISFECLSIYTHQERVITFHASKNDLITKGSEKTLFHPCRIVSLVGALIGVRDY